MTNDSDDNYNIIFMKYMKYKKKFYQLTQKKLLESIYPTQYNDFYFLIIPDKHPDAGKTVPIDWRLKNLVLFFWNKGFITLGVDQGDELGYKNSFIPSFISFDNQKINGDDTMTNLKKILLEHYDRSNIKIINKKKLVGTNPIKIKEDIVKTNNRVDNILRNYNNIVIIVYADHIKFYFRDINDNVHKKFGIKYPSGISVCPGRLHYYDVKNNKIIPIDLELVFKYANDN